MRRGFCVLISLFLCAVICSGCGASETSARLTDEAFSSVVTFTAEDTAYTVLLTCTADGTHSYTVQKPEHLADFSLLFFADGRVQSVYHGLTYDPGVDFLPYGGPVQTLEAVLRHGVTQGRTIQSGKELFVTGQAGEEPYRLAVSPTGLPLFCTAGGWEFLFSDVTML